jgi:acetylornithine aminotransferase/acetylornithine/N-succinyldiaminopimelate aminotransferase
MQQEASLLLPTYERFPILFKSGAGVHLYDANGKAYLDFLSGIGVNALGYGHPEVQKTICEQSAKLIHISNLFYHEYQAKLAAMLTKISGLDRVFFCNSGTEAWEGALKLARAYAKHVNADGSEPKSRFLMMHNSFHGRTYGSLSTTGQQKYQAPFAPLLPGVDFVTFNDVADLKSKFDDTVCAIGLEAIQGEGGIQPVTQEFIDTARELTKKSGALLIVDEIQSGLGRTGKYFAHQNYGVKPDIVTIAKPLAGGLPLGAILVSNEVSAAFHPGMHGTTFGGGPLACAVAVTVLEVLERERMLEHVVEIGNYFQQQLNALKAKHAAIVNVRGMGLMVAAELNSADLAKAAVREMLEKGIIINRTHDTVLRFLPPFVIGKEHVDQVVSALDEILSANAQA